MADGHGLVSGSVGPGRYTVPMRLPRILRRRVTAAPTVPLVDPTPEPPADNPAGIAGALLGLAYATDETAARYWLALLARRGAPWDMQREAWALWEQQHRANVHYLHTTDRPEEQRP